MKPQDMSREKLEASHARLESLRAHDRHKLDLAEARVCDQAKEIAALRAELHEARYPQGRPKTCDT